MVRNLTTTTKMSLQNSKFRKGEFNPNMLLTIGKMAANKFITISFLEENFRWLSDRSTAVTEVELMFQVLSWVYLVKKQLIIWISYLASSSSRKNQAIFQIFA